MAMANQIFLPVLSPWNTLIGAFPITATTFTGNEETHTVNGATYAAKKMSYTSKTTGLLAEYSAIAATGFQMRNDFQSWGNQRPLLSTHTWDLGAGSGAGERTFVNTLELLLNGTPRTVPDAVLAPLPVPAANPFTRTWYVNWPATNAQACDYIDLTWSALTGFPVADLGRIAKTELLAPTADPGTGLALRAMMVYQMGMSSVSPYASTVRIVNISRQAGITPGTYTWPLLVTLTDGQTMTITLNVAATAATA